MFGVGAVDNQWRVIGVADERKAAEKLGRHEVARLDQVDLISPARFDFAS
jgi:hypothetical protein